MGRSLNINKTISLAQQQLTATTEASESTVNVVLKNTSFVTSSGGELPSRSVITAMMPTDSSFPMLSSNGSITLLVSPFSAYTGSQAGHNVQVASDSSFENVITDWKSTDTDTRNYYKQISLQSYFGGINISTYNKFFYRHRYVSSNQNYLSEWSNTLEFSRSPVVQTLNFKDFTVNIKPIYFGTDFGDLTIDGTVYQMGEDLPIGNLTSTTGYKGSFKTVDNDSILVVGTGVNAVSNRSVSGNSYNKTITKTIPAGNYEIYVVADRMQYAPNNKHGTTPFGQDAYYFGTRGSQITTGTFTLSSPQTATIYMDYRDSNIGSGTSAGYWQVTIDGNTYTSYQGNGSLGGSYSGIVGAGPAGSNNDYGYGGAGSIGVSNLVESGVVRLGQGNGSGFGGGERGTSGATYDSGTGSGNRTVSNCGGGAGFGIFNGDKDGYGADPYNSINYGCVLFRRIG